MKTNTLWKRLVIVVALGVALAGVPAYPALSAAMAADPLTHAASSGGPSMMALSVDPSEAVTVWNQEAVRLTLLPASALAPVQQTRTMAIVQVAVHDAVNGLWVSAPASPIPACSTTRVQ